MSKDPHQWAPPLIAVIGVGIGPKSCTVEGVQWIERADVLVGGARHLDFFPEHPGEKIPIRGSITSLVDTMNVLAQAHRVAVLASGDPLFFGIGRHLTARLSPDRLHFIPGPTSIQALCAALGRPWEEVRVFSLHGRETSFEWMWFLRHGHTVAFFTDKEHPPRWIADQLMAAGFDDCRVTVAEDLGLPTESLGSWFPCEVRAMDFSPLNVVMVTPPSHEPADGSVLPRAASCPHVLNGFRGHEELGEGPRSTGTAADAALRNCVRRAPGVDDGAFVHREGLITKKEVRSVALSLLRLAPGDVFWDIGAGSGSIAVEAALLYPLKSVWAVERVPERVEDIRANVHRFHCGEIQVIAEDALQAVSRLPRPDRVFIGGSGGMLTPLLDAVWARMAPFGRVVVAGVTWNTLAQIESFAKLNAENVEAVQVQVNRGVSIGSSFRFTALNPVFLCAMEKTPQSSSRHPEKEN